MIKNLTNKSSLWTPNQYQIIQIIQIIIELDANHNHTYEQTLMLQRLD